MEEVIRNMNKTVLKYASLARLAPMDCKDGECDNYTSFFRDEDFKAVLNMIQSIQKIDTDGIPHHFMFFDDQNFRDMREDEVVMNNTRDDVLSNAQSKMGYFVVPKVIDGES